MPSKASQRYCRTTLNYAAVMGVEPRSVDIEDGREESQLQWQQHGFERIDHDSEVRDWDDEALVAAQHYDEMAALAVALTGCRTALISGHIARNPEQAALHTDYAPIEYVHSDFTDSYGDLIRERYGRNEPLEQAALDRAGISISTVNQTERILILQFWRNVGPRQPDRPIAFCDAQTVPREDLLSIHVQSYAGGDFPFDTFGVTVGRSLDQHRWYTFPALTANEVVVFRTFDSDRVSTGQPYWTPHSAFLDPIVGSGAPARRSIEIRATCLF